MSNILVYNNRTGIVEIMSPIFEGEGLHMTVAGSYQEMLTMLTEQDIHLLITDVKLRQKGLANGIDMIARIRKRSSVPIIVISAEDGENSKIMALNAGADDYIVFGASPMEILARVKSQLRRYTQLVNVCSNIERIYKVGELVIDDTRRKVSVDSREVKLTPIEYKILRLLVQEKGKVLSITQIYESIWQMQAIGADNTIAVHIRHIREKIEQNPREPRYLQVVWGTGYKVG